MNIKVFSEEKKLGLEDLIRSNATIAYCSPASSSSSELSDEEKKKIETLLKTSAKSNPDQIDLYYLDSVLVSTGWNKNDDVFLPSEAWVARHTPEDKQFNYMHDEDDIIGHITGNCVIDQDGKVIADELGVESVPKKFDIIVSSVLYNSWSSEDKRDRTAQLIKEIEEGKWYVSMECLFAGFDYALTAQDETEKVVERNETSAFLTKHLKAYGGTGEYEGYKLGRLLRNISFSGKGLVNNPANPKSVILKDSKVFSETKACRIEQTDIRENNNMSNDIMLEKQVEDLKAELAKAKQDEEALRTEISQAKDVEIQATFDSFKSEIAEAAKSNEDLTAKLTASEEKITELEQALSSKEEELTEVSGKVQAYETEAIVMARKAALVEAGVEGDLVDETVTKFAEASEEMFEQVVSMLAAQKKKMKHYAKDEDEAEDKKVEADQASEEDAIDSDETDESEASADEDALEEAEEVAEASLVDAGESDEVQSARAYASEWLEDKVLKSTNNLGE